MQVENFISVNEAADLIGVTVGWVRNLLISEKLEGKKINDRAWMVSRRSAEKYARENFQIGRPRSRMESARKVRKKAQGAKHTG